MIVAMAVTGIIIGMLDPITALFGIVAGIVWRKSMPWAIAILLAATFLLFGLAILTANAHREQLGPYPIFHSLATCLWAAITFWVGKLIPRKPA